MNLGIKNSFVIVDGDLKSFLGKGAEEKRIVGNLYFSETKKDPAEIGEVVARFQPGVLETAD